MSDIEAMSEKEEETASSSCRHWHATANHQPLVCCYFPTLHFWILPHYSQCQEQQVKDSVSVATRGVIGL